MNKLVSKNPVLRFKLGRKIVKAEDGWRLLNGRAVLRDVNNAYDARQAGDIKLTHRYTVAGKLYGSFDGGKTYYGLSEGGRPLSYKANQQLLANIGKRYKKPEDIKDTGGVGGTGGSGTGGAGMSYQFGKMGGWSRSIGKGTINDPESLRMLEEMGMKDKSAKEVQDKINEVFGPNAVKSDDLWGNQSRKGLAALYERWKSLNPQIQQPINTPFLKEILEKIKTPEVLLEMKNLLTLESFEEYPQLLNDLQIMNNSLNFTNTLYRSVGPYEQGNSSTLKDYGIKDYNSLVNYVKNNPNAYISTDLTNTFGDVNNWNLLDFENQIGIGGHYGRMNRNALWGYLNGLKLKYNSLTPQKLGWMVLRKQGGQLVSRNPVKRFKSNFR